MKILQYVNDINGNTKAIQIPLSEEKVLTVKKYEQALKLKSDLKKL